MIHITIQHVHILCIILIYRKFLKIQPKNHSKIYVLLVSSETISMSVNRNFTRMKLNIYYRIKDSSKSRNIVLLDIFKFTAPYEQQ